MTLSVLVDFVLKFQVKDLLDINSNYVRAILGFLDLVVDIVACALSFIWELGLIQK